MTRTVDMPGRCRRLLSEDADVERWLHARTLGIGGSEVAALVGASPYATSWDVFQAKVTNDGTPAYLGEEPISGPKIRAELLTDNPIFEWGHRLEEAVALKVADELNGVHRPGGGVYQHLDHPVAIVTPDRVLTKPRSWKPLALIECKHSGESEPWDEGLAPLHYQIQAQWQMGITGLTTCYLGCFILNFERDFYIVRVDFDEKWFNELVEVAEAFWRDHVLTGELPEHDFAHPRTGEILKEQHPRAVLESVQWGDEAREWIEDFLKAKRRAENAAALLEEQKNWLRFHIGDAGAAYIGDDKVVSYPEVVTRKISATKLRENFPEVAESATVVSSHRRMTVKRPTALPELDG